MKENSPTPFFVFTAVCGGVSYLLGNFLPMSFPVAFLAYGFYANHVDANTEEVGNNSTSAFEEENNPASFPLLTDQFIQDDFESSSTDFSEIESIEFTDDDFTNIDFAVNPANGVPMISGGLIDLEGNAYGTDFSDDYASTFDDPFESSFTDPFDSFNDISSFDDSFMS